MTANEREQSAAPAGEPPTPKAPPASRPSATKQVNPLALVERLTLALQLGRRARNADPEELPFVMVNETRQLLPYRQAFLCTVRGGKATVAAVSGLAVPDRASPYAQWLSRFVAWRLAVRNGGAFQRLDLRTVAAEAAKPPNWLADWPEWLPPHALWAPLLDRRGRCQAVLALWREEPFSDAEAMLFSHLAETYSQSLALAGTGKRAGPGRSFRWLWLAVLVAAAAAFFIPTPQTVLAPAEIAARRPALVRAGIEGVVDRFLVEPNQRVEKGDRLVVLDDTQLRTRLAVAKKAEDMAAVEYRQLQQAALSDPKTKQRLPLALGRMEQPAAETAYIESLMERVVIASPIRGIVLCDNPDEWLGRPVSLGQRIMLVADPDDLELEIRLPVAEALGVAVGDDALFYPNVAPVSPLPARISFVGYRAGEAPGLGMAYTIRADLAGGDAKPLLGLRGTAKLYGETQFLGLIVLRKPIAAVRQWLGW